VQINGNVFPTIPPLFLGFLLHRQLLGRLIHGHRGIITIVVVTSGRGRVKAGWEEGFAGAGLVVDVARDVGLVVDVGGVLAVNLAGIGSGDLLHIKVLGK
jgi:hypothetical protein